jgi:hypothetical protein
MWDASRLCDVEPWLPASLTEEPLLAVVMGLDQSASGDVTKSRAGMWSVSCGAIAPHLPRSGWRHLV